MWGSESGRLASTVCRAIKFLALSCRLCRSDAIRDGCSEESESPFHDVRVGDGEKLALAHAASPQEPVVFFDDNPARGEDSTPPRRDRVPPGPALESEGTDERQGDTRPDLA